jgi:TatD DNase family protein
MKRYLDIHSHHLSSDPDVWTLRSLYKDFHLSDTIANCSIGLHPWYLDNYSEDIETVRQFATHPSIRAMGECGLDKVSSTPFDTQKLAFEQQIELANKVNKPLIIHCVRAFDETIEMLQEAKVPVIFHGFQKNPALAQQLLGQGFYLSFGAALTNDQKNAIDSLASVPADRFFLETDDSTLPIQTLYQKAATIRATSEDELIAQIHQNYQTVFKL